MNVVLSPGQTHETQLFDEWWNTTEVTDLTWKHLIPPDALAGDKGYRSAKIVDPLTAENVEAVIPEKGRRRTMSITPTLIAKPIAAATWSNDGSAAGKNSAASSVALKKTPSIISP